MIFEHITENFVGKSLQFQFHTCVLQQHTEQGWIMRLPQVQWHDQLRLCLLLSDYTTWHSQGCYELDHIAHHYGARADQVVVLVYAHDVHRHYHGPLKLIEWPGHLAHWVDRLSTGAHSDLYRGDWLTNKTNEWQCLNGRIRPHREHTAAVLSSWPGGTVSLGMQQPYHPWTYAQGNSPSNWLDNFRQLHALYQRCVTNVVTESVYQWRPGVISEKTLHAFVACQVPILIAHPGSVNDCRRLGFDMFDDILDNSFDLLPNDQRLHAALELNRHWITDPCVDQQLRHRLWLNHQHVFSGLMHYIWARVNTDLAAVV